MSMSALLIAVRDRLKGEIPELKSGATIGIQPDGRPDPNVGQLYVAIHGTDWSPTDGRNDLNVAHDEQFGVTCTITRRTPFAPGDKHGETIYVQNLKSIEALARKITVVMVRDRQQIINDADELIIEPSADKFIEPLRWQGNDPMPTLVSADWFGAEDEEQAGMTMDCNFGLARRFQHITVLE